MLYLNVQWEVCQKNAYAEVGFRHELKEKKKHPLNEHAKCSLRYVGTYSGLQGLQILLLRGVTVTSASQILESFWNIWSQVSQRKKPFSDFPARGPGKYTLSRGIHEVAVAVL